MSVPISVRFFKKEVNEGSKEVFLEKDGIFNTNPYWCTVWYPKDIIDCWKHTLDRIKDIKVIFPEIKYPDFNYVEVKYGNELIVKKISNEEMEYVRS